jgi:hypothetical protein
VNVARIALFFVVALAVALTANLVLLNIANGPKDPVGRLSPRAGLVKLPPLTTAQPPAQTTTQPPAPTTTQTLAPTTTQPPSLPTTPPHGEGSRGSHQDD